MTSPEREFLAGLVLGFLLGVALCLTGCSNPAAPFAELEAFGESQCGGAALQVLDAGEECATVWLEGAPEGRWLSVVGTCQAPAQCLDLGPGESVAEFSSALALAAPASQLYFRPSPGCVQYCQEIDQ